MPDKKLLRIIGAREHNLKNISVDIPRDQLVVITGLSGSGKSSLAFDTIYAEGQRRYVESLSSYARQFLGIMEKPDVDQIDGLSPAISIDQKSTSRNPRSTVGTITEIYDLLRLMFARVGTPHCPNCGKVIDRQSATQIVDLILEFGKKSKEPIKLFILGPLISDKKGEHKQVFERVRKSGFVRVRVDGNVMELEEAEDLDLDKQKKHSIEVVVDRLVVGANLNAELEDRNRIANSVEKALEIGSGLVHLLNIETGKIDTFSEQFACSDCGISLPEIEPRLFSFNNPFGACPNCHGLGYLMKIDRDLVVPNKKLTIAEGAIKPLVRTTTSSSWYVRLLEVVGQAYGFTVNTPFDQITDTAKEIIFDGAGDQEFELQRYSTTWEGVIPNLTRRHKETESEFMRAEIERYMIDSKCLVCDGKRLKPEALAVKINQKSIAEVTSLSIDEAHDFVSNLKLTDRNTVIAKQIVKEAKSRLNFLQNVGLAYLNLDRSATTLSGGEAQRIRLATQIGSSLMGVLYILDEPSIGLHQRDNAKLLDALKKLRDLGNSVIVVEHDQETMEQADFLIDIGPGAGENGGNVVAIGTPTEVKKNENSVTGQYLSGKKEIATPKLRREITDRALTIVGATQNNLQNIDVKIPLGVFVCVSGVSGSGKSTLINDILAKTLEQKFHHARTNPGKHKEILGLSYLDKVITIDQSPIGRTPRSNPATYTGLFTFIRDLFSLTSDARMRGYKAGRFSFNVKGGRCETCHGDGVLKIEMHFLPDVYVTCEECHGKRYNHEALEIKYKGKNISEVLDMTVEQALEFFDAVPAAKTKLQTLFDVGLGYIHLGQPATTLSGGEAQRVKLATELSRRGTGKTFYILDEPTTGLHFEDVKHLISVLQALVDKGNSVLVIEHNLDVIKSADYVIDLGPEGGVAGGLLIASGTPEEVAKVEKSSTGQYLKNVLKSN
ncbi:MAG: excinuclease ABC subunit UvrA [Patescibacteria group bacterium]|jgi:excinuclease ABC subunit A